MESLAPPTVSSAPTVPPLRARFAEAVTAPELAEIVAAKLRQVQLWTDAGIIICLPGTKHQGRGTKRLYDGMELPVAMLASVLARLRFPIGMVGAYAHTLRGFIAETQPEHHYHQDRPRAWYRLACRGDFPTWLLCFPEEIDGAARIVWEDKAGLCKLLPCFTAAAIINTREVVSPFVE